MWTRYMRSLPAFLVLLRFLLGPFFLFSAFIPIEGSGTSRGNILLLTVFILAFLSDVFDGIIARRLHVATEKLREYDGLVDVWFYCWVVITAWIRYAPVIRPFLLPLLLVVSTQCLAWFIDWLKFRRLSSYHAYSSKTWGITLFLAFAALFGSGYTGVLFWMAVVVGIISHVEEIAMTLVLPHWIHDVPGIVQAVRLRQRYLPPTDHDSSPPATKEQPILLDSDLP
jgi:phosphatidylglycerophosphate synthase